MAKSITSVCAVVCSSQRTLFSKGVLVRHNSNFVSLRQVLNHSRALGGHASRQSVRNQSSLGTCTSSFILESPLGPIDVPDVTLSNYIWKDFEEWSDKPAITCGSSGRSYTYGEARFISHAFATALIQRLQLKKGDVVGLLMPNVPEYVFAIHGALEAGLTVTFVNPLYTSGEILRQFENANVKCCVTITQLFPVIEGIGPKLKGYRGTVVVGGETDQTNRVFSFKDIVTSAKPNVILPEIDPNEVALLPFSSGTTGMPKGVMLTHKNCVASLRACEHPDIVNHTPTSPDYQERILSVLPFFHIYGFNAILNTSLLYGLHMISIPKFTPESYIECVLKYKPTFLFVVPSLLLFLASHPAVKPEHLASIKEVTCGAAPATKSLIEKFYEKVGRRDIAIRQGYGMTETSPVTLFTPTAMPESKAGSAGRLVRGTRAKVVSLKTGETLGPHNAGELYVQGPQVMAGYLNNEEATKETIDAEGWLRTGDVAYYDEDGYFFIVDRTKELIKVKGNQVSPTELEGIIMQMPGVADCAVVGIPDILSGEIPRAFVVRRPGYHITESEVTTFLEPKVAAFKKLAGGVRFLDIIPRNPAGKVLREELKVFGTKVDETATA